MVRGQKVSEDLAWTVIRMLPMVPLKEISLYTKLGIRTIEGIKARFQHTGQVVSASEVRRRRQILSVAEIEFLNSCLADTPDLYLDEMQDRLRWEFEREVSLATIWRYLRRSRLTRQKMTRKAIERSAIKRGQYFDRMLQFQRNQLVFVDESAADCRTTYRGYAWSIWGQQAEHKAYFVRGKRYSMLPALSLDGILHLKIVEGSFDSKLFTEFIDHLLDHMNPFLQPNSVIVMDNCRIHKNLDVLQMIINRGMRYEFLPPYSPDLNPIEEAFSAIKAHIRRHGDIARVAMTDAQSGRNNNDVYLQLTEVVWSVTAEDAEGWFRHAGY